MITTAASLERGPVLHFGVATAWACLDSCSVGESREVLPMVAFGYAHDETVFMCHVLQAMCRLDEVPRVTVMGSDMYVTYGVREAPMTCLTHAAMYVGVGLPVLTRAKVCSVAAMPAPRESKPFFEAFRKKGKFVLVITGPNNDPNDPLMTVGLSEIGNKL